MSTWIVISLTSLAAYIATFLLAEWIANDGSLLARQHRPFQAVNPATDETEREDQRR